MPLNTRSTPPTQSGTLGSTLTSGSTGTCSTLKALQLLGNSVHSLSWANWRMVYNAIILPILTYATPMWFSGQAGLLRQLCTAQNAAVWHPASTFSTTHIDPLHQLMGIMPIDLQLQLLIKNVSLHLYRIPTKLPTGGKSPRTLGTLHLWFDPTSCLQVPPYRPYCLTLLSLTANLPATPHIDLLAAPPWNLNFADPSFVTNPHV
jgi:hypothetical protein